MRPLWLKYTLVRFRPQNQKTKSNGRNSSSVFAKPTEPSKRNGALGPHLRPQEETDQKAQFTSDIENRQETRRHQKHFVERQIQYWQF